MTMTCADLGLFLTANQLDELSKLQTETRLTGEPLITLWLNRSRTPLEKLKITPVKAERRVSDPRPKHSDIIPQEPYERDAGEMMMPIAPNQFVTTRTTLKLTFMAGVNPATTKTPTK